MNKNVVPLFTPAEIAVPMGNSSRTVGRWLERSAKLPSGIRVVNGKPATAYSVPSFPDAMYDHLAEIARKEGCRNIEHLLSTATEQFQPAIPLGELAQHCLNTATLRRRVLEPILRRFGGGAGVRSEMVRQAYAAFNKAAGYKHKDDRTLRRWIEAAIHNDRGRGEWDRLEIYLDTKLARRPVVQAVPDLPASTGSGELARKIGDLKEPSEPTSDERHSLWVAAMAEIDERLEEGESEPDARHWAAKTLWGAVIPMAKTEAALYKRIKEKRWLWLASGRKPSAIKDHRSEKSGNHAPPFPEEDRLTVIASSVEHGGRVSEGFREALEGGKLSPQTADRFIGNPAKSHVPRRLCDAVADDVRLLSDRHHGPRQALLNGAYIDRDWSDVAPGTGGKVTILRLRSFTGKKPRTDFSSEGDR